MERIKYLIDNCSGSVLIDVNEHKSSYSTVEEELEHRESLCGLDLEIDPGVRQTMIDMDTMVNIQFYPNTPIGFYSIYHYDVSLALDEAVDILKRKL